MGITEFRRIWGDRILEDNWRRSQKSSDGLFVQEEFEEDVTATEEETDSEEAVTSSGDERSKYLSTIPFNEEQQVEALVMIEDAHYNLGNIYNFQLEEQDNAIETFETLLTRFPDTDYEPEVLYLLYLVYNERENDRYEVHANKLQNKFPNTIYAKLISNPNYREESTVASEKLKSYYHTAFELYSIDSLDSALTIVYEGMMSYPDNTFSDNMKLLEILILGK
ncbi:methyltransferase, partial [Bacteroidota bacterium]